ncbi:MAG: hypothetical protein QOH04_858 [Sphingomonadales bacterium]|jgi:hypothetical protein|nr:hypothetical protein [Sphingomonadales bacterium]MEA3035099.1 hypothetical protein [Sphingomonadales bacterium]
MADQVSKVSVDDIVAAAGAGAMRAMAARGGGEERLSVERLVASGFGVHFQIWAGGWPGPWGPNGPLGGGIPGGLGNKAGGIEG